LSAARQSLPAASGEVRGHLAVLAIGDSGAGEIVLELHNVLRHRLGNIVDCEQLIQERRVCRHFIQ